MGYIVALVLLLIVVPLLFLWMNRRPGGGEGGSGRRAGGVSVTRPSSDQPTPGAGNVNEASQDAERRVPPG
jgi:hypothetical protein